uniref:DUF7032 domain-containing protein n=2 Tax=Nymphaea colorata TaxID=210225 RepID=A0A5K0W2S9_9MAGN
MGEQGSDAGRPEEHDEQKGRFQQPDNDLQRALDLIVVVTALTQSTRAFAAKWQSIRAKLERLRCDLSNALLLLASSSASASASAEGEIPDVAAPEILSTLTDCAALARSCTELSYSGKLLMQSDLDGLSGRLDVHLRHIDGIYKAGTLGGHALALVVSRPPTGASKEDMRFFVRDLFTRVQIGSRAMKSDALRTLEETLREDDKYQRIVVETGDVAQLVTFLESDDAELSERSAGILSAVAADEENKAELVAAGVVFPAIRMIETGGAQGREAAATLLNRLTANSENAWSVSSQGGVTVALAICRKEEGALLREAAGILRNLAGVEEIAQFMMEEGVASVMFRLLKSSDEEAQACAADCLRIMSAGGISARNSIIKEGGIPLLVSVLGSQSLKCREFALRTIGNLTSSPNSARLVLHAGFLSQIPAILRRGDFSVQEPAARAVRDIAKLSEDARKSAGEAGIMPEMLKLLEAKSLTVKSLAAEAISELLTVPKNRSRFVQEDGSTVRILRALDTDEDSRVRQFLLLALVWISNSPAGRRKISSSGSLQSVERLAKSDVPEARRIVRRVSGNKFRKILDGIWKS